MIKTAGLGVAVNNSDPIVKQQADNITENDDDFQLSRTINSIIRIYSAAFSFSKIII